MSEVSVDDIRKEIEKARRALAGTYVLSDDFNTIINSLRLIKSMVEDYYASLSEDEKKLFSYTNFMNFKMYVDMLKDVKYGDFVTSTMRTNITKALVNLYDLLTKTGSKIERAERANISSPLFYGLLTGNKWLAFKFNGARIGKGEGDLIVYAAVRSGYALWAKKNINEYHFKVHLPSGNITSSIVVGVDGDVYLTSEDGYVYQFSAALRKRWRRYVYEWHPLYCTPFIKPYEREDLNSKEFLIYTSRRPIMNIITQRGEFCSCVSPVYESEYDVYSSVAEFGSLYGYPTFTAVCWSEDIVFEYFDLNTCEWKGGQAIYMARSYSSPAVVGDVVRVGGEDNKVHIFLSGVRDSTEFYYELTTISVGGAVRSTLFAYGWTDFGFGCNDFYIYRYYRWLDAPELKWKYLCGDAVISSPAYDADESHVVCGCDDCYIYCINDADGTLKWRINLNSRIRSSPAISASSRIYITNEDGYLYEIEKDGTLIASLYIGSNPPNVFAPSPCVV